MQPVHGVKAAGLLLKQGEKLDGGTALPVKSVAILRWGFLGFVPDLVSAWGRA